MRLTHIELNSLKVDYQHVFTEPKGKGLLSTQFAEFCIAHMGMKQLQMHECK